MGNYRNAWLPHLKDAVPKAAQGNGTCMYVMSLEGWRRGLELRYIKKPGIGLLKSVAFSLSDGKTTHVFNGSRGDYVTKEAIKICSNKGLTNKYLADGNVPIPGGKSFSKDATNKEILNYAKELGYPVVLKPSDSEGGGFGVITNLKNEEELNGALKKVRDELGSKAVILERFFVGEDFRVYVLEDKVIGAFHRRAQSVLGDGSSTIKALLSKKNKERQQSPFLAKSTIKIDNEMKQFLNKQGLDENSVPKKGERIFLRPNGAFFKERDSINWTDKLSPKMKEIAISAVKAIPGLPHAGVDMLIDLENDIGVVNEVNSRAQISNHIFPVEGEAVDIPKLLIDYYFPETKNVKLTDANYNFDFKMIIDSFDAGSASEIKIPPIPKGLKSTKRYVVTGTNFDTKYRKWLQRRARENNLHGYVRTIDSKSISVVVSGSEFVVDSFKNVILTKSPKTTKITKVTGAKFNGTLKVGFELRTNSTLQKKKPTKQSKQTTKQKQLNKKKPVSLIRRVGRKVKRILKR